MPWRQSSHATYSGEWGWWHRLSQVITILQLWFDWNKQSIGWLWGVFREGDLTSVLVQRCLYRRFTSVSLREETERCEGSNEILSMNSSCESGLGRHPLNMETGLIFVRVEISGATDRRFSLQLRYRICDGLISNWELYIDGLIRTMNTTDNGFHHAHLELVRPTSLTDRTC